MPAKIKRWNILVDLIRKHDLRVGAEVGVKRGNNINMVLRACPKFLWYAIDLWAPSPAYPNWSKDEFQVDETSFDKVLARYSGRVRKMKMDSIEAAAQIEDNTLDLVFIDGDHSYEGVKKDLAAWIPKIVPGGFISGHDYGHARFPGVKQAVDEAFPIQVSTGDDTVWYLQI